MPFPWQNRARRQALQHTIEKDQPNGYVGVDPGGVSVLPPALHAATHEGGSDPISVLSLGGYPGGTALFLRADKSFAAPPGAGSGDVVGPASAVADHLASYNGVTGKLVKDSGLLVADVVVTTDARMTNARTPTAHTHPESDVTNLVTDLAARKLTDQATSNTGTQNNFNLGARMTYLRCDGAAPVFTGFTVLGSAPVAGDLALVHNTGTGVLRVATEDVLSTAVNRAIGPSIRGQIVGVGGMILIVYDGGATSRWRIINYRSGAAILIPYNAGDFPVTPGAMTVTVEAGDYTGFSYLQYGNLLHLFFTFDTVTTTGTADGNLLVKLPGGFSTSVGQTVAAGVGFDGGASWFPIVCHTYVPSFGTTYFSISKGTFTTYALIANGLYVRGSGQLIID